MHQAIPHPAPLLPSLSDQIKALIQDIESLKAERVDAEVRTARVKLAAVHAQKRLVRRERDVAA